MIVSQFSQQFIGQKCFGPYDNFACDVEGIVCVVMAVFGVRQLLLLKVEFLPSTAQLHATTACF